MPLVHRAALEAVGEPPDAQSSDVESSTPVLGRVRRSGWERLAHGLYVPAAGRTQLEDLRAWQVVLPSTAAFTHLTAAMIRGWWEPATIRQPVFATIPHSEPRPRRPGLVVSRHPEPPLIEHRRGLRVTTAADTLLEAARDLAVLDLVVLGDCALRMGHLTIPELQRVTARRRRGAPLLRQVIPLLDDRSESPWESIMRVLHLAAEIPVTPQYKIYDDRGRFVARADLRIDGTRRLQEYDGADLERWFPPREPELVTDDADPGANPVEDDQLRCGWSGDGPSTSSGHVRGAAGVAVAVQGVEHAGGDFLHGAEAVHADEQVAGGEELQQG